MFYEIPSWLALPLGQLLFKGAGHKYIRRVATGNPKRPWRYFYRVTGGKQLGHEDEMTLGAAFKIKHAGKEGHFHIVAVAGDRVRIQHDESGHEETVSKAALAAMLHAEHAELISRARAKASENVKDAEQYGSEKQKSKTREAKEKLEAHFGKREDSAPPNKVQTRGLLAGAYKGGRANLKTTLTHAIVVGADATLCGIPEDHVVDRLGPTPAEIAAQPSCPKCRKKDPRNERDREQQERAEAKARDDEAEERERERTAAREKREREEREAHARAEQEAREAREKRDREEQEAKAREEKERAEREAKEAEERAAKAEAEQARTTEAATAKLRAEQEAREAAQAKVEVTEKAAVETSDEPTEPERQAWDASKQGELSATTVTVRLDGEALHNALQQMGDYLHGVDAVREWNSAGFNKIDYGYWGMTKNPESKANMLRKYRRQLVDVFGPLYYECGLGDPKPKTGGVADVKMTYEGKSLVIRIAGRIKSRDDFGRYVAIQKEHGMRFTGDGWAVRDLNTFDFNKYQRQMTALGINVGDIPAPPEPPKAAEEVTEDGERHPALIPEEPKIGEQPKSKAEEVANGIKRQTIDDHMAVIRKPDGSFTFYTPFSRKWNEMVSNKDGNISGIMEVNKNDGWSRSTMDLDLVDEVIGKVAAIHPEWKIVTSGLDEARKERAEREAELQKQIPALVEKLAPGMALRPYQNEGVRFLEKTNGNALIGDEMGLGKTLQSLSYCAMHGKKVIVVCPKAVRRNWTREAEKFFPGHFNPKELKSADIIKNGMPDLKGHDLVSVNYESLEKFRPALEAAGFDTIIVDESHRIKDTKTKLYKNVATIAKQMKHRILMSGTAIKNKREEMFPQLDLVKPGLFKNPDEIRKMTIGKMWTSMQSVYIARQKAKVAKDLPSKVQNLVHVDVPKAPDIIDFIDIDKFAKGDKSFYRNRKTIMGTDDGDVFDDDVDHAWDDDLDDDDGGKGGGAKGEAIKWITRTRHALSQAKVPHTVEQVQNILENSDDKVLVFTESRDAAEKLAAALGDLALLHHGQMTDGKREAVKDEFMRPETPKRVLVTTASSLNVGANLQAANHVVFNDLPWTAADVQQAEDRAHRIGQSRNVNVHWVQATDNLMDTIMTETVLRKYHLMKKVTTGKQATKEERAWMEKRPNMAKLFEGVQKKLREDGFFTGGKTVHTPTAQREFREAFIAAYRQVLDDVNKEAAAKLAAKDQKEAAKEEAEMRPIPTEAAPVLAPPSSAAPEVAPSSKTQEATEKLREGAKRGGKTKTADVLDKYGLREVERNLHDGSTTPEKLVEHFEAFAKRKSEVMEDLGKLTKDQLVRLSGNHWNSDLKKERQVAAAWDRLLRRFLPSESMAWSPMSETIDDAVRRQIKSTTTEAIKAFSEKAKASRAEYEKKIEGLKSPKTLEDFQALVRLHGGDHKLSSDQRKTYDSMVADVARDKAEEAIKKRHATPSVAGASAKVVAGKHTKKGHDIFTVQLENRVSADDFKALSDKAKSLGGYYSSFRGNGAIPGFIFSENDRAKSFAADVGGGEHNPEQGIIAPVHGNSPERLRSQAATAMENADDDLGRDRQINTARRANMAANAETTARAKKAQAETMQAIADAQESGEAKHLWGVSTRAHVELLEEALQQAKYKRIREEGRASDEEAWRSVPTDADVEAARFPHPYVHKDHAHELASSVENVKGAKQAAKRILDQVALLGENEWRLEADTDRLRSDLETLAEIAKKEKKASYSTSHIEDDLRKYRRATEGMSIESLPHLRAALREYARLRVHPEGESRLKSLKRQIAGSDIPGYFPTPPKAVARVMALAAISPGDKVLEPSAGSGALADAAKHAGGAVEAVERHDTLRQILGEKGHKVVGSDAIEHRGEYDKIVMNPPFEGGQDIEHVQHAFKNQLKDGGRLVAIVSRGALQRSDAKAKGFQRWIADLGGKIEDLPEGTFAGSDSERKTWAAASIVVLDRPGPQEIKKSLESNLYNHVTIDTTGIKNLLAQRKHELDSIDQARESIRAARDPKTPRLGRFAKFS